MKKIKEAAIRDALASDLSIIEKGLNLLEIEYFLPNPDGGRGFIDILAKDQFGHHVIIEVKRSNQAAREALHELCKYPSLLRQKLRLPTKNIRCIVVSTEWHELLRPFSEFARLFDHVLDGYEIKLDLQGNIKNQTRKIEILSEIEIDNIPKFYKEHSMFLFEREDKRLAMFNKLVNIIKKNKIEDFCLLSLDYREPAIGITNKYVLYFAFAKFTELQSLALEEYAQREYENNPENIAETIEGMLINKIINQFSGYCNRIEASWTEKFSIQMVRRELKKLWRYGVFSDKAWLTDYEVLMEISGISNGTNSMGYIKFLSPRYLELWQEGLNQAREVLLYNRVWQAGFKWFMQKVLEEMPEAIVSIRIHSDNNILFGITSFLRDGDLGHLPQLQIVVEDPEDSRILLLQGFIEWNHQTFSNDPHLILQKVFNDDKHTFGMTSFNRAFRQYNEPILDLHGLRFGLIEAVIEHEEINRRKLKIEDKEITFEEINDVDGSFEDWFTHNIEYIKQIDKFLHKYLIFKYEHPELT